MKLSSLPIRWPGRPRLIFQFSPPSPPLFALRSPLFRDRGKKCIVQDINKHRAGQFYAVIDLPKERERKNIR